jgi:hypothetical protein
VKGLINPALTTKPIVSRISHVISRLAWYNVLPNLLFNHEYCNNTRDRADLKDERVLLRSRILEVYKAVLLYHIRIVCFQGNEGILLRAFPESSVLITAEGGDILQFAVEIPDVVDIIEAEEALSRFGGRNVQSLLDPILVALQMEKMSRPTRENKWRSRTGPSVCDNKTATP